MENLKGQKDPEATGDEPGFSADLPLGFLSPTDKPGQLGRLERYDVLEEIGRGGMGVVLKAFDPSLHRVVAIKVLAPQLATSGVARKRFLREAKAAAAVTHDHIVTIHAVDEANGLPYLVMQYVAGRSLQERIDKEGPLELVEILRIGMQTASGLAAAHGQGIVHRDIKPANILLEDGVQRVKITDFGLARAMDDASLTQSGFVAGSPLYMAPEQARGEALDHRADLFSLGSVLYTMCTGHPPFRAANTLAVLRRVSEDVPRPIRETNPEIPEWLAGLVEKLQAKDPADRFQSAAEVVEVLGQHLAQLQHAAWVPPPAPSPPPVGANTSPAGLPTSLTICPNCGANLHVPERMVGSVVHCAECGKPFHVEEGSEVIQVARVVPPPRVPAPFRRKESSSWVLIVGLGLLLVVFVGFLAILAWLFTPSMSSDHQPVAVGPSVSVSSSEPMQAVPPRMDPFWKNTLSWLPGEATFFGAVNLEPFGSLTLDDATTQSVLRLVLPEKTSAKLTPENFGRIRMDSVSLAYYAGTKPEEPWWAAHLFGVALDGRKLIVEGIRREISDTIQVEENANGTPSKPICVSGPGLPFALGIYDDNHVFLARSLTRGSQESQHRKALAHVNAFDFANELRHEGNVLSGYNPPWLRTALEEIPPEACCMMLGEIPAEWRKVLTESLELRACPRTFVFYLKREGEEVVLSLALNLEKAGAELLSPEGLEKWRRQALDALQARFPSLRKDPEALALLGQTLNSLRWGADPGSGRVRIDVRISGPTWKALGDLLKRVSRSREEG
jgi:serine/threonine protein kinase